MSARSHTRHATGRTLEGFSDALSPAERTLLGCAENGTLCRLSDVLPASADPSSSIRSQFLRFLMLGGDERAPVHESGIRLQGCWIAGDLDLSGCEVVRRLFLDDCVVDGEFSFVDARLRTVFLQGCRIRRIHGTRSRIEGSFACRNGTLVEEYVWMWNSSVSGFLSFAQATVQGGMIPIFGLHEAIALEAASIGGDAYFSCDCRSRVSLDGCRFGKDLVFSGGSFRRSSSDTDRGHGHGTALDLHRTTVDGTLWLTSYPKLGLPPAAIRGCINLQNARVSDLADCHASLPQADEPTAAGCASETGCVILDGFRYARLIGDSANDVSFRRAWLQRQPRPHLLEDFRPHPFEELIRALRSGGRPKEAVVIGVAKQDQIRRARAAASPHLSSLIRAEALLFGGLLGYGYRLHRFILVVLLLWLAFSLLYYQGARQGQFGPLNASIYTRESLAVECRKNWSTCDALPKEHEHFNAFLYSADVILPFLSLKQEGTWGPLADAHWYRLAVTLQTLIGWAASLIIMASVSGLIKKD